MINGLEGIPGAGKSFEATVYHVLHALQAGRMVITNLPLNVSAFAAIDPAYGPLLDIRVKAKPALGTWDASAVDDKGNGSAFVLFPDARSEAVQPAPPVFGHVWDFYSTWKHPTTGQGPLIIIDECHVAFNRRKTPDSVIEWFKLHRHFNIDVLLMTQNFRHIHGDIADLLAMLVKVRSADILGRADSYIRKVHAGYRGAVISTDERKYKPEFFPLYKSHTQGNSVAGSVATDVAPFNVKFKRFSMVFYAFTALFLVYTFYGMFFKDKPKPKTAAQLAPWAAPFDPAKPEWPAVGNRPVAHQVEQAPMIAAPPGQEEPNPVVEPFAGKLVHLTGWMKMGKREVYTFTVSGSGRRLFDLELEALQRAGYVFTGYGECAGVLSFAGLPDRPLTCDAPVLASGSQSKPIVVLDPANPA